MKTLQAFWCSFTVTWLRKSKVPLDMKVVGLKMCFCLLTLAKRLFLDDIKFETHLKSLCEAVTIGIMNVILSRPYSVKWDGFLGLGINVREELKVSSVVDIYRMVLDWVMYIYP